MPNPGQPTIRSWRDGQGQCGGCSERCGARPNPTLPVDGVFGPQLEAAVKDFQQGAGLAADGIVGPLTWSALPDGTAHACSQTGLVR